MAISLLDLLGFGSDRAIANAGRETLRLRTEQRLVDDLVDALARHDASQSPGGTPHGEDSSQVIRRPERPERTGPGTAAAAPPCVA